MNYPKISIITPSFNQGKYLEYTIKSVLDQNYPNLEYIIIDGGSTDDSVEIIKRYESRLAHWESATDNGMYDALNKGFAKSTGEIMAWVNSDDMYHPNSLFTVAEIFTEHPSVQWITGAVTFFDERNRTVNVSPSRQWSIYDILNGDWKYIQQESTLWSRSLWNKTGGFLSTKYKYAGDFELWTRFFLSDKLFVTDALIGGFRFRKSNQFSLDHLDEYHLEGIEIIKIANRSLDKKSKVKVTKARNLKNKLALFRKIKMLSLSRYFEKRYERMTGYRQIHYSTSLSRFILKNES